MPVAAARRGTQHLVLAVADRHRAAFARNFKEAMREVASRITVDMVEAAIDHPAALSTILQMVDNAPIVKVMRRSAAEEAIDAYAEIFAQAAKATIATFAATQGRIVIAELQAMLNVKSPFMQAAARDMTAKLVTRVNGETKRAIRGLILDAHRNGMHPYETSQLIKDVVGLTPRQSMAVRNFKQGLLDARDGTRSIRGLKGQWTLSPKVPLRSTLSPADIRRYTDNYAEKLLEHRAYTIARTETLLASNMGQQLTWREMANQGFIDGATFVRVWSTVSDGRLCEECAPMEGQTVGLEDHFVSSLLGIHESERVPREEPMTTLTPPLHPSCRCVIVGEGG